MARNSFEDGQLKLIVRYINESPTWWVVWKYNMAKRYDFLIRLLLLGDSGVGKTCMIYRFADDTYLNGKQTTIGKTFYV